MPYNQARPNPGQQQGTSKQFYCKVLKAATRRNFQNTFTIAISLQGVENHPPKDIS